MSANVTLRFATVDDAEILAGHRVSMFRDMGFIRPELEGELRRVSVTYFTAAIPAGEYVGWLGSPPGESTIVAGAGLQFRSLLPRPNTSGDALLLGREGQVLNVYTDEAWRRRGVAKYMMDTIIEWAKGAGVVRLVLSASQTGRPVYERAGFVPTREMIYTGPLAPNGTWTGSD